MRPAAVALAFLFLMFFVVLAPAHGQISPGPLSKAHESLSGPTQCSSCHKTGGGSAALKCQECHTEIAKELSQGRGLHSTFPNKETCAKCHSDHNGEDFPLIHWVPSLQDFDHKQTGYPLSWETRGRRVRQMPHGRAHSAARKTAYQNQGFEQDVSWLIARLRHVPRGRSSRSLGCELFAVSQFRRLEGGVEFRSFENPLPADRPARSGSLCEVPYSRVAWRPGAIHRHSFREVLRLPYRSASRHVCANLLRWSGVCAGAVLIYASLRWHNSIILLVLGEILFCAFFIFPDLAWGLERPFAG